MPYFSVNDVCVEIDEFLYALSDKEVKELINVLIEDDYINEPILPETTHNMLEEELLSALKNLYNSRLRMSYEDEQQLLKLSSKYL